MRRSTGINLILVDMAQVARSSDKGEGPGLYEADIKGLQREVAQLTMVFMEGTWRWVGMRFIRCN